MLAHVRELIGPRRRRLRLDAERADARAEGRRALRQPVARARVPRRASTARCASATSARVDLLGLFHARKLRAHQLAIERAGWDRVHARAAHHQAVLRPLHAGDLGARLRAAARRPRPRAGPAGRAAAVSRARSRSSCTPTCPTSRASARGRSARSGCGRRSRPATCRCSTCSTRHPGRVTLSLTPVLADQLEAPGALERCLAFLREIRPESHRARHRGARTPAAAPRSSTRAARYARGRRRARAPRRPDRARFAPHVSWTSAATHAVLPLLATDAGVRLQLRDRDRGAPRALRRLGRRLLAARVRARAVARRAARGGGRARRRASTGPTCSAVATAAAPLRSPAGRCSCRSTARRSSSCGATRGYPSHGDYRDTHRAHRRAATRRGRTTARRTTRRAARARARADARGLRRARRARARRRLCVVALDTELLGHYWHEGVDVAARGARAARDAACDRAARRRCSASARRAAPALPADELGRRRATCAPGARPRPAGWPGASAAPSCARSARRRPSPSARCASCSRCRAPTGRS